MGKSPYSFDRKLIWLILEPMKPEKIAILGYGSQGRAWALNLKDSGGHIVIGLPVGDSSRLQARRDGWAGIMTVAKATSRADMIIMAFPDHLHGRVFTKDIAPNLTPGMAMVFLHGFSIHFKTVIAPKDCDIILLAPLGPGAAVREKYLENRSVGFFHAVYQNGSGHARARLNYLAKGLKINKQALIKTTFAEEAIGDLFGEQVVLCGGLSQLILAGFDTLVKAGLTPDKAYLEVCYQLDLIVDLIKKYGIEGMFGRISVAARYGSLLNGPKIIDRNVRKNMKSILDDIKSGRFAARLDSLDERRLKTLNIDLKELSNPLFEKSARRFSRK